MRTHARVTSGGLVVLAGVLIAGPAHTDVDSERLTEIVRYLSDDEREGRGPGSDGLEAAARRIEKEFDRIGLEQGFESGYSQAFADTAGRPLRNLVGIVPGVPGEEHLIIGAHYDHLGIAPPDSTGKRDVFNGADDNASGVAALLEIARAFADRRDSEPPGRTLVFIAFSGEETGLLGSQHYVKEPALSIEKLSAMLNLDTIGRLRDDRLLVFGTGTAAVFEDMLSGINRVFRFDLARNQEGIGAGDHESFFRRGVPVLHLFTDGHPDYHRTGDTHDKINVDGLARVTEFAIEIVSYLSDPSVRLEFVPVGAEKLAQRPPSAGPRKVSLGTIPDFSRESGGILVTGVLPASPAETAGIKVGDLIVEIDGTTIDTLQDYQSFLESRQPGDTISVAVVREGERLMVTATLVARRSRS